MPGLIDAAIAQGVLTPLEAIGLASAIDAYLNPYVGEVDVPESLVPAFKTFLLWAGPTVGGVQ